MAPRRTSRLAAVALALSVACSGSITGPGGGGGGPGGGGGGSGGGGGGPDDEQFPPLLLQPYGGPPIDVYDNTFLGYMQLKGKVATVFGDAWVRGGVDQFQANIGLLGGADFTSHFVEARVATPDFLLALDSLSKDVCSAAVTAASGPFAGINVATPVVDSASTGTTRETAARAAIDQLYRKLLFRRPTTPESGAAYGLLKDLVVVGAGSEPQDAWSGVCEALVRHPDFLWTLPPSRPSTTGAENQTLLLVKVAQDLAARPPTDAEIQAFVSGAKTLDQMVDGWLASAEFKAYAYYKMRIRTESDGTSDSDEPARLWTRILTTGTSYRDLLTGDYGVDTSFQPVARGAEHGNTGALTMKGYIQHKPGLPHYNYSARVLSDFMGYVFEVPPEVIAMRIGATASSTVDPNSICFTCHQLLTPLAYQRSRWSDDGVYQTTDADGKAIDDSDHGLVAGYPYKGEGMAAFTAQAVKKERFVRQTLQAEFNLLFGRPLRFDQDERGLYKQLWDTLAASNGDLRSTLKVMVASPQYQGN
jgi:hypothetical protein